MGPPSLQREFEVVIMIEVLMEEMCESDCPPIIGKPWSSMQGQRTRRNKTLAGVNGKVCSKKGLTEPASLEMFGNPGARMSQSEVPPFPPTSGPQMALT
jgi:hypothetical protein